MAVQESSAENSIKKFYENEEIFITGGSGFIGRVLIEKLLRSCGELKKIFLLMRPKKGIKPIDRIESIVGCKLFNNLRSNNPNFINKIEIIEGNVMEVRLGISEENFKKIKNCSIIFHCAASVRFNDELKDAILMNTRGTREVCEISKELRSLKALVHVSTSYIRPKLYHADEIFYPAEFCWKKFIKFAETYDNNTLNGFEKKLTNDAPNTYTFTKHMSEQVCKDYRDDFNLPIVIYRPSIITSSEFEPFEGWIDNLNGPIAICLATSLGLYHVRSSATTLDSIPVDIVVKGMLISAWKTWKEHNPKNEIPIYNAASVKVVPDQVMTTTKADIEYPPLTSIMYRSSTVTSCKYQVWKIRIIESIIPGMFFDTLLRIFGQKPRVLQIQRRILESERALKHFSVRPFKFINHKFLDLELDIPKGEENDFFIHEMFPGQLERQIKATYKEILEYFFNQTEKDFEKAKKRRRIVIFASRTYYIIASIIYYYLLFGLFSLIMNRIGVV